MGLNYDKMRSEASRQGYKKGNKVTKDTFAKINFGDNKYFILAPEDNNIAHYYFNRVHFGFSSMDGSEVAFRCTYEQSGDKCPLCEAAFKLRDEGNTEGYNNIKAKPQFIYNVLTESNELKILRANPSQKAAIEAALLSYYDETKKECVDTTNGRFLKIKRMKIAPWCIANPVQTPPAFTPEVIEFAKNNQFDLSKIVKVYTVEELQQVVDGTYKGHGRQQEMMDSEDDEETTQTVETPKVEEQKAEPPKQEVKKEDSKPMPAEVAKPVEAVKQPETPKAEPKLESKTNQTVTDIIASIRAKNQQKA
jgi:hypothetical protein